ncbi:hydrolase [Caballeronia cordobensis]|uniref:Hydrolase n=1 Tax=Caballeronia cordobensis TaxID=1353886 RepID=A0A158I5E7_CABCO|nr:alpha/beta hydrolase [Caballeronia cordobensis]SAL51677.1 hydrolase [Caballeronia cordobensis]
MANSRLTVNKLDIDVLRAGHGRALLFLHPHLGRASSVDVLTALSESFDVIAPSHPGFDQSSINDDFDSVDDLAYFYLDLLEELDLKDVVLVGSSFGGWVALEMAVKSVERIGQVVLIDSVGVKFGHPTDNEIADVFSMSEAAFAEHAYFDRRFAPPPRDRLTDEELLTVATNREASARFAWLPCLYSPKLRQRLGRADRPTLVIQGANDAITAPSYGRELAAALPCAEYREIVDAGHFPHIEQPAVVAREIVSFVQRVASQQEAAVSIEQ